MLNLSVSIWCAGKVSKAHYILWEPWIYVQNVVTNHQVNVKNKKQGITKQFILKDLDYLTDSSSGYYEWLSDWHRNP